MNKYKVLDTIGSVHLSVHRGEMKIDGKTVKISRPPRVISRGDEFLLSKNYFNALSNQTKGRIEVVEEDVTFTKTSDKEKVADLEALHDLGLPASNTLQHEAIKKMLDQTRLEMGIVVEDVRSLNASERDRLFHACLDANVEGASKKMKNATLLKKLNETTGANKTLFDFYDK